MAGTVYSLSQHIVIRQERRGKVESSMHDLPVQLAQLLSGGLSFRSCVCVSSSLSCCSLLSIGGMCNDIQVQSRVDKQRLSHQLVVIRTWRKLAPGHVWP